MLPRDTTHYTYVYVDMHVDSEKEALFKTKFGWCCFRFKFVLVVSQTRMVFFVLKFVLVVYVYRSLSYLYSIVWNASLVHDGIVTCYDTADIFAGNHDQTDRVQKRISKNIQER